MPVRLESIADAVVDTIFPVSILDAARQKVSDCPQSTDNFVRLYYPPGSLPQDTPLQACAYDQKGGVRVRVPREQIDRALYLDSGSFADPDSDQEEWCEIGQVLCSEHEAEIAEFECVGVSTTFPKQVLRAAREELAREIPEERECDEPDPYIWVYFPHRTRPRSIPFEFCKSDSQGVMVRVPRMILLGHPPLRSMNGQAAE